MTHDHGNRGGLDKKRRKQLVIVHESPPLIPKRYKTKVQGIKASTYGVLSKKAMRSSDSCLFSLAKLCGNFVHVLPEDSLKKYTDKFLYKLVSPEYYVNSSTEAELKTKFLKPFADNNLLTIIRMSRKHNPDYVNAFYCNLELTSASLQSRFKDKIMKFNYSDFITYFGMKSEGTNVSNSKGKYYVKVSFVLDISKFVREHMEMLNLRIGQIKFGMRLIHWVFVKFFPRKLGNSSRADDIGLLLMWYLIYNKKTNRNDRVKFIIDRMIYYRDNLKKPISSS